MIATDDEAPPKKPRRGRPPIIRSHDVVAAALYLTQSEGLLGWSMLDVARRLNVSEGAVYRYFTKRDLLADEVCSAALADVVLLDDDAEPFERIEHAVGEVWDRLLRHPGVASRLLATGFTVPSALRFVNHVLGCLLDAGLGLREATAATSVVCSWMGAAVQLRQRFDQGVPSPASPDTAIEAGVYPHLSSIQADDSTSVDQAYVEDLHVILSGIKVRYLSA